MAIIQNWLPPSRENWELLTWLVQFFPLITLLQYVTDFYPMGKTSIDSRFNLPGKVGWATMECGGFIILLYNMFSIPPTIGIEKLPAVNWLMGSLFTIHYINRSIITPLFLNPSMSPIHPFIWIAAFAVQITNGTCIGGWLGGYGPTTADYWRGRMVYIQLGVVIFLLGLIGNFYYDDELRELRRSSLRDQKKREGGNKDDASKSVEKVYKLPQGGLFDYILFPHYFCEWIEWVGFWIVGGWACLPVRNFVGIEVSSMTPRALSGKRWYLEKFGKGKIGNRKAVIPGII